MRFSGARLDELMLWKDIDNRSMAKKTEISEEDLKLFRQGKKVPNVLQCIKMSYVLKCSIWDFLVQVKGGVKN